MANNGWIKTRRKMKPEQITSILEKLNTSLFKNNLQIEYHISTPESPGWGPHTWLLKYESNGSEWASRICWLETSHNFVMRHGGGTQFAWWIDTVISNEVAVYFDGTIGDDAISDKWKGEPGKFSDFSQYLECMLSHIKDPETKKRILESEYQFVPSEFQNEPC